MTKKLLLAILLLTVSTASAPAQTNPEQAILSAREQFSDIKNRSIQLERMKRDAYKQSVGENFTPNFPEIKKDFEQIQKINSNVLLLTAVNTPMDYRAVLNLVSEINHRAVRLKSNLFPSEPKQKKEAKNKEQIDIELQDVKKLLETLDKSINSFVHNSIFQNINLVNTEDSLKAQKDLETVIKISNTIKVKTKN